jgi:hypothetical protein
MDDQKPSRKEFLHSALFSRTGEAFLDCEIQPDPLFAHLLAVGEEICAEFIPGESSFHIVDGIRIQASVNHEHQAVLVYKGMLDFLFRIASMLVGADRRKKLPEDQFYEPWSGTVRSWLSGGEFNWEDERFWWLLDEDYRLGFDATIEGVFRFLVFHEVGHLHNMHRARRELGQPGKDVHPSMHYAIDDSQEHGSTDRLAAHAREIVADTYAFHFLFEFNKQRMLLLEELQVAGNEAICTVAYAISIWHVASFFWSLCFILPSDESQRDCYPSHLFRLQAIEATSLEHGVGGMDSQSAHQALHHAMLTYVTMLNPLSANNEFVHWRLRTNDPAHVHHYELICAEVPHWSNTAFGIRDEFLEFYKSFTRNQL